jgi:hypothetical protein
MQLLPEDQELPKQYRTAVEEIAGFRPVLAYQLRGKERYFDLRKVLTQHLSRTPGSPVVASQVTEILDSEIAPLLEETLVLLAKSHSVWMRFSIKRALHNRSIEENVIPPTILDICHQLTFQITAANKVQSEAPGSPSTDHPPSLNRS